MTVRRTIGYYLWNTAYVNLAALGLPWLLTGNAVWNNLEPGGLAKVLLFTAVIIPCIYTFIIRPRRLKQRSERPVGHRRFLVNAGEIIAVFIGAAVVGTMTGMILMRRLHGTVTELFGNDPEMLVRLIILLFLCSIMTTLSYAGWMTGRRRNDPEWYRSQRCRC